MQGTVECLCCKGSGYADYAAVACECCGGTGRCSVVSQSHEGAPSKEQQPVDYYAFYEAANSALRLENEGLRAGILAAQKESQSIRDSMIRMMERAANPAPIMFHPYDLKEQIESDAIKRYKRKFPFWLRRFLP